MVRPMIQLALSAVLLAVPIFVLLYLGYRVAFAGIHLYRSGRGVDALALLGTTIVAAGLVGIFASEKTLLVVGLLAWMYLVAALIHLVFRKGEAVAARHMWFAKATEDQDPSALNFSGVGPGSQGFGLYAGGVRIAHDPLEDG